MEEKVIEARFRKNILAWVIIIASLIAIMLGCYTAYNDYRTGTGYSWTRSGPNMEIFDSFGDYLDYNDNPADNLFWLWIYCGGAGVISGLIIFWLMNPCALTITNTCVIGKASFGKRVDLPVSQISSVGLGSSGRITIATSSGKIHFWLLANREEVHSELAKVINKVQVEKAYATNTPTQSNADELRKYKELLDDGVISQEEFDAKKKQLLGL